MSVAAQAARLKSLKSKRAQIKGQCTRFQTHLDELNERSISTSELRQRLQKFSENWELFNETQASIEELEVDAKQSADHEEERNNFERRYFEIMSELEFLIESWAPISSGQNRRDVREGTPAT